MDLIIVCHTVFGSVGGEGISWDQNPVGVDKKMPNQVAVAEQTGVMIFAIMPEVTSHIIPASRYEIALQIQPRRRPSIKHGRTTYLDDHHLQMHGNQTEISTIIRDHLYNELRDQILTGRDLIESHKEVHLRTASDIARSQNSFKTPYPFSAIPFSHSTIPRRRSPSRQSGP